MHSGTHPHGYAAAAADAAGLVPLVVHSTSWRLDGGNVVLTYIVVSSGPLGCESFDVHGDHRHETATDWGHTDSPLCGATAPPIVENEIDVVHHGLHHLALLAQTDAAIAHSLGADARVALLPLAPMGAGVLSTR